MRLATTTSGVTGFSFSSRFASPSANGAHPNARSNHSPTLTATFDNIDHASLVRVARFARFVTTPSGSPPGFASWFMSPSANRSHPNGSRSRTRRIASRSVASLRTDHRLFVFDTHRTSSISGPRRASRRSDSERLAGGSSERQSRNGGGGACVSSSSEKNVFAACDRDASSENAESREKRAGFAPVSHA